MKLRTKTGRLSDVLEDDTAKQRADWSYLKKDLAALEPGDALTVNCPLSIAVAALQSTILTIGNRVHKGEWAVSTRRDGKKIKCFLVPKQETRGY